MNLLSLIIGVAFLGLMTSCGGEGESEKCLRSVDSLSGALHIKLKELQQIDSNALNKALTVFNDYRQFIAQNVNDTVSREDADHLQRFYSSGRKLNEFMENRRSILGRGQLINSQLRKLSGDLKNHSAEEEKIRIYLDKEKRGAEEVMKGTLGQQQKFNSAMEEFRLSVTGIEALIRSHNNGELPTIISGKSNF